ncbi:hypothetical protein [Naumannella halotolerans]|uniref:PH (Pleckstrin Homology) domain-containing protein n=1 Tax=Naumannella halotolerans TaxID=993414 RepID=A0A4R7J3P8_9ACTN|nr:hypothetical protein [Naumannella halotolerans]TDT30983.1 hypothetical protein CLV29_2392 [Naumannella halotolerans]
METLKARKDPLPAIVGTGLLGLVTVVFLVSGRPIGWWQAAAVVIVLTTVYGLFRWSQGHTTVNLCNDKITVSSPFGSKEVRGGSVTAVREMPNGRSPNHLLLTDDGRKVHVPSSEVERGHSALFDWLAAHAPQAELDKRSIRTRRLVHERRSSATETTGEDSSEIG